PGLAFAGQPDAVVLVDAGGNLHRQCLVLLEPSRALERAARIRHELAGAVTRRARLLDREEALRHAHLAAPVTRVALLGLRPRLCAAAVAGRAFLERRDANLRFGAARRFLEAEFQVVAKIGAAIDA